MMQERKYFDAETACQRDRADLQRAEQHCALRGEHSAADV